MAVDYFTKWVEAESLVNITWRACKEFFWKNVICRFGVPNTLITDNGTQFDNDHFRAFCATWGIQLRYSSVAHPQTNGQAEAANKVILDGLKKKIEEAPGVWVDELPNILWAYRTTPRTSTGETPFQLAYGNEAVVPVEIGIPSVRTRMFDPVCNDNSLRINLDLVDEVRDAAAARTARYK